MLDHISDYLFAPTFPSVLNLAREFCPGMIVQTGNTVVDSLNMVFNDVLRTEPPSKVKYALLTLHREENVDDLANLKKIVKITERMHRGFDMPIIFPIHPRTRKNLDTFGLSDRVDRMRHLCLIDPLGYLDFLKLMADAAIVLTDFMLMEENINRINKA